MVVYFLNDCNGLEKCFQNRVFRTSDNFDVASLLRTDYYFAVARNTFQKHHESSF